MFVVYHKETTRIVGSRVHNTWKSMGAAKAHLGRMAKMGYRVDEYEIASYSFFSDNIEKTVVRKNLMSGKEFTESVNTPHYCSPSSESYWSM
jgi:hypothetical protein